MTMLAEAGLYLVLDVNSPLEHQNLNRYEPWTTYNEFYLEHVFKVVEQFSHYQNTLAFFAGNEVVNDARSAKVSSTYVKGVIRDLKNYIAKNSPRKIPVGYSAADDLHYRIPFAKYLECEDENNASVDFYGVNSYQWCGVQSFESSGYTTLVRDYSDYTKPIFFSEYGCNEVQPRIFQEVESVYSKDMIGVFSGGLIYEFSQEPNNYGLVEHDPNGNAIILPDFHALKQKFEEVSTPTIAEMKAVIAMNPRNHHHQKAPLCEETYQNLDISKGLPLTLADSFVDSGASAKAGRFVTLQDKDYSTRYKIFDVDGSEFPPRAFKTKIDINAIEKHVNVGFFQNGKYCDFEEIDESAGETGEEKEEEGFSTTL